MKTRLMYLGVLIVAVIFFYGFSGMSEDTTKEKETTSSFEIVFHKIGSAILLRSFYRDYIDSMHLKGNEKLMDFGSGWATMSELFAKKLANGGKVSCVDISELCISYAKKQLENYNNVDFKCGDIASMEIPESTYDVIVIHFVLHDIDTNLRDIIIKKHYALLKTGGKIFIREPIMNDRNVGVNKIHMLFTKNNFKCETIKVSQHWIMGEMIEAIFVKS